MTVTTGHTTNGTTAARTPYGGGRSERPWLPDVVATAPEPAGDVARRRARRRAWRARFVFALVVAGFVALGARQITVHLETRNRLALGTVTVQADPVDVVSTSPGTVADLLVRPQQEVAAGEVVAVVEAIRPAAGGTEQRVSTPLVAPFDAVVSQVPAKIGSALTPGAVVVRLYKPERLYFQAQIPLARLSEVSIDMTGELRVRSLDPIAVRLAGIEPAFLPNARGERVANLELEAAPGEVERLVPGVELGGWLDTSTAPAGAPTGVIAGTP